MMRGGNKKGRAKHCRRRDKLRRGAIRKPLSECCPETSHVILDNSDRQSMEMGLFGGATVKVMRNSTSSPNMIVGVNDSRYMLSKETAKKIIVG